VAIPTVGYLATTQTVKTMPLFMYIIMAAIGILFTLIGSYLAALRHLNHLGKTATH